MKREKQFRIRCCEDDVELTVPAAATCKSRSSDATDVFNDLLDRARFVLGDTRHAESTAAHSCATLEQSREGKLAHGRGTLQNAITEKTCWLHR